MAEQPVGRESGFPLLSSEPVKLDAVRSLDGLCLLVHCRLYQRIYIDSFFFRTKILIISPVVFSC